MIIIQGRTHAPQDIEQTVEQVNLSIRQTGFTAAFTVEIEDEPRLVIVAEVERRYHQRQQASNRTRKDRRQPTHHSSVHQPLDIEDVIAGIRHSVSQYHNLSVYAVVLLRADAMPKTRGKIQREVCRANFLAGKLESIAESRLVSRDDSPSHLPTSQTHELLQWLRSDLSQRVHSGESDILLELSHRGLLTLQLPVQSGGLGFNHHDTLQVLQQLGAIDISLALFVVRSGMGVTLDHYPKLSIAALCLGGMKRCAQLMVNEPLDHPVMLMRLSELTMAIAAVEALVNQMGTLLDQDESIPSALYFAGKAAAPEFFWQAASWIPQPQMLKDANLLRRFDTSIETLYPILGAEVIHHGNDLYQFLRDKLQAPGIAENLRTAAFQIHARYANSIGRFASLFAATQWAESVIGEVTTWAILWAAVGRALDATPSRALQQAFTWAQLQFEHRLFQALIPMPTEMVLATADEMVTTIADYSGAIGGAAEHQSLGFAVGGAKHPTAAIPRSVQTWITQWIAQRLGIDSQIIHPQQPLSEYGVDSMIAIELMQDLGSWFPHSLQLDAKLVEHFPTLGSLASHLDVRINQHLVDRDED
jgi:acyl carrier protein